ncbi:MAG: hypothetical protein R2873_22180 [Caldilineaceae bacterium]
MITISYAIPVGIFSATHQYSVGDNTLSLIGFLGLSLPGFLLALFWMFVGALVLRIDVAVSCRRSFPTRPCRGPSW